jgi:hypothetical protein
MTAEVQREPYLKIAQTEIRSNTVCTVSNTRPMPFGSQKTTLMEANPFRNRNNRRLFAFSLTLFHPYASHALASRGATAKGSFGPEGANSLRLRDKFASLFPPLPLH